MAQSNPFLLAADNGPNLLPLLRSNPSLASSQDAHGYSLMHAAASYNHIDLLRSLVNEFQVNANLKDEDGETSLFVVETVEAAKVLIEELKVDVGITNTEGLTAEEKIREEGDYPTVADFLHISRTCEIDTSNNGQDASINGSSGHPPPLPPNVTVNVGTLEEASLEGQAEEVDPEFKQRIEELAAREDFQAEEGQRRLRELIADAVKDVGANGHRDVRRRLE
ncbi:hypothetical protein MMC06_003740 [Schaereria dolodes]|nr:hypothetical protein [Schaereria dolodes]